MRFDNSYSWTRSKKVFYSVKLLPPDNAESEGVGTGEEEQFYECGDQSARECDRYPGDQSARECDHGPGDQSAWECDHSPGDQSARDVQSCEDTVHVEKQ